MWLMCGGAGQRRLLARNGTAWCDDTKHGIIYSLKYAIHSQIATNDHFGRNAFRNVDAEEKIDA